MHISLNSEGETLLIRLKGYKMVYDSVPAIIRRDVLLYRKLNLQYFEVEMCNVTENTLPRLQTRIL